MYIETHKVSRSFSSNHAASWFKQALTNSFWILNACCSPVYVQMLTYANPVTKQIAPTPAKAMQSLINSCSKRSIRSCAPPLFSIKTARFENVSKALARSNSQAGMPRPASVAWEKRQMNVRLNEPIKKLLPVRAMKNIP